MSSSVLPADLAVRWKRKEAGKRHVGIRPSTELLGQVFSLRGDSVEAWGIFFFLGPMGEGES